MSVSRPVREYYAKHIFAQTTRTSAPPNFRPLPGLHTGRSVVEGCRGGGKNILEIHLVATADTIADLRVSCGLCNPAMLVAADIVVDWARGRSLDEVLALESTEAEQLAPFFERLGGEVRPDDAREKFQYALLGVQSAVRDHRGEPQRALPRIAEARERNLDDEDDDQLENET